MNNDFRLKMLTSAILLALLLSVAMPLAALAQDETSTPTPTLENSPTLADTATPEPSATETAAALSETPTPTDSAPTDTETPSETPTLDLSATATATPSSETPTATVTSTETPTITPTHSLPLESSVFDTNEVIWCPATVAAPVEGSMGCIGPYTELNTLRANLSAAPSVDGKIWIGDAYAGSADVSFTDSTMPTLSNKKLTIQGGWTGPGGTINTASPSFLGHLIQVLNWTADVTMNDIDVDGVNAGDNLVVVTSGKITLLRVNSTGAFNGQLGTLNNLDGSADVVITSSLFNLNTSVGQCGLVIDSNGMVTLSGVQASSNNFCGADVENNGTKNVSIANSTFSSNTNDAGLLVDSTASIVLTNVTAEDNAFWGLYADSRDGTGSITISSSQFDNNSTTSGRGLELYSKGNITLTGVQASGNFVGGGAVIYNDGLGFGNISISTSTFSNNASNGVEATSNGSITLNTVTANSNSGNGALLYQGGSGSGTTAVSTSTFTSNTANGLLITARGLVTLTGDTATLNSNDGANIDNTTGTAGVTASTSTFNSNSSKGLNLLTNGAITFTSLTANLNNGTAGISASNTSASTPKNVTVNGSSEFSNNRETGLAINTKGSITTNDISALGNGILATTGNGVSLNNTFGANPGLGVTLNGTNYLSGNFHHGVLINSYGAIKLNNVFANSSVAGYGTYLINNSATTAQSVTLTGSSQFNYNSLTGLLIQSHGAVMLNSITANGTSTGIGAYITNDYGGFTSGVTLTGTNTFLENFTDGIHVTSRGAIAASNVTADDNGGFGVYFFNTNAVTNMAATLSGINSANSNVGSNVFIESNGIISVASVTANESVQGSGMFLINTTAAPVANKGVNISGVNVANDNGQSGVQVETYGAIVATTISASDNGTFGGSYQNGIYFSNDSTGTPVTLNGINVLNGNNHEGLEIISDGVVKINSVTANSNSGLGLKVDDTGSSSGSVSLTGTNSFDGNGLGGVEIDSSGPIALNNVSADDNGSSSGIRLVNSISASTPKNVTLTGVNTANGNWRRGLDVSTYGDISVASLSANGNGVGLVLSFGEGAVLDNLSGATTAKKITFTGTNSFSDNFEDGLYITSLGAISLSNVTASGNGDDYGVYADNDSGVAGVTLTGINTINENAIYGVYVITNGPIAASSLRADGNLGTSQSAVTLINNGATTAQNVTVSGVSTITDNGWTGVEINTKGTVSIASMTSTGSVNGYGLDIDNLTSGTASVPKSVTLTGVNNISSNTLHGLFINTYGPVSVSSLTASNNGSTGALIDNSSSTAAQNVAFTGLCYFIDNGSAGLIVYSKGKISSSTGLTALNNTGDGVYLYNAQVPATPTDISILGTNRTNNNTAYGFRAISHGMITTNNLTANNNGTYGFELNNNSGTVVKDLKLTGTNVATGNTNTNATLVSLGAISINNLTASESTTGSGAELVSLTEGKAVSLTGSNYFNSNWTRGLGVYALGNISASNLNANFNGVGGSGDDGIDLSNDAATVAPRSVTLTGTNVFIGNDGNGLAINSDGLITTNNLRGHNNARGARIDNSTGTAAVVLNGINSFRNNVANGGVHILSLGAVTVNKITVENNVGDGLNIDPTPGNVTLMCGTLTNNTLAGIRANVSAPSIFKMVGIVTSGNGTNLIYTGTGVTVVVRNCL